MQFALLAADALADASVATSALAAVLLQPQAAAPPDGDGGAAGAHYRSVLAPAIGRLDAHLRNASTRAKGIVTLKTPSVPVPSSGEAMTDYATVSKLEECLNQWQREVAKFLENEKHREPSGNTPLDEVDFWKARAGTFGSLVKQLSAPEVTGVVAMLRLAEGVDVDTFTSLVSEAGRRHGEAKVRRRSY